MPRAAALILFAVAAPLAADDSLDGLFDNVMDIDASGGGGFGDGFTPYEEGEEPSFSGDIDSLFEDAQDVSAQEVQEKADAEKPDANIATGGVNSLLPDKSPFTISGKMKAELGAGFVWDPINGDTFSGYFDFENYLTFSARASRNLSVTGEFLTEFPEFEFSLNQIYFDYRIFDRVYITGGKRQYKWGYVRLFDDEDEYETDDGEANTARFQPNILYDSKKHMSARVIIPVSVFSFTGVAMLPLDDDLLSTLSASGEYLGVSRLSFAWSIEARIKRVTVNLFGRKFPDIDFYQSPIFGAEVKTSFFGVDLYAHTQMRLSNIQNAFLFKTEGYEKITTIAGAQWLWDKTRPVIALAFEYQNVWNAQESSFVNRLAFVGAVSKIGPGEHITVGVEWNHNITDVCGDVTPGIIISGLLPHARWKTAAEIYYGEDEDGNKISRPTIKLGTTIYIEMNY